MAGGDTKKAEVPEVKRQKATVITAHGEVKEIQMELEKPGPGPDPQEKQKALFAKAIAERKKLQQ